MSWLMQATIATILFGLMHLSFRFLTGLGLGVAPTLMYVSLLNAACFAGSAYLGGVSMLPTMKMVIVLIITALFSFSANLFYLGAMAVAPNPGYVIALNSASTVIVLIASVFLFGSEINIIKVVGVMLVLLGVACISIDFKIK